MDGLQDLHQRTDIKLSVLPRQRAHALVRLLEQLPASDQLRQDIKAARGLERLHQLHHERVVHGGQDVTFPENLLWHDQLAAALRVWLLPNALQRVAHTLRLVLDEPHGAEGACANQLYVPQGSESDGVVLEVYAVDQLCPHVLSHHLLIEGSLAQGPELRLVAAHGHRGTPLLGEEQRALAEAGALPEGPHLPAVKVHSHLAAGDNVEQVPHLALLENAVVFFEPLQHKKLRDSIDLLLGEVSEDGHLLRQENLSHVVNHLFRGHGAD
mmetsp:Transcript_75144/g.199455  ORF Transcript_75144/g.199455 Transcript_75144/m.199455 type:complete len:269 (-) Transcript_75144:631-1437(-)